ncbi:uncharacterized protein prr36a [Pholidichthys leucotaenia]
MKPDGVNMEASESTEGAGAAAEQSSVQENVTEQTQSRPDEAGMGDACASPTSKMEKPVGVVPKVKPKAVGPHAQPGSRSRPGTGSHRMANDAKSSSNVSAAAGKKTTLGATAKPSSGVAPKRPTGTAATHTTANQIDKRSAGPARTATAGAAATGTDGTKTAVNTTFKRPASETVNGARPKTSAFASRTVGSTVPKPSTSTTVKAAGAAALKTTRPAAVSSTSRPTVSTSRPTTAPAKPFPTAAVKTSASRVTTAPSAGRTTSAQPPKTTAVKKDVSQPPSTSLVKKPAVASSATKKMAAVSSPTTKKAEPTKLVKASAVSKPATTLKAADSKVFQPKSQQSANPTVTKKPVAAPKFPISNKPPLGRPPPSSPTSKSASGTSFRTKRETKPTQTVMPFNTTNKAEASNAATSAVEAHSAATGPAAAAAAAVVELDEVQAAAATVSAVPEELPATVSAVPEELPATVSAVPEELPATVSAVPEELPATVSAVPEELPATVSAVPEELPATVSAVPEELPATVSANDAPLEVASCEVANHEAASPAPEQQLESSAPSFKTQEEMPALAEPSLPHVASSPDKSEDLVYLSTDQTPSACLANAAPHVIHLTNLNEEDDEEEKEGSQMVSVSEMSGTTQPTEESRPGSAGPVGGAAWRAGGALLSELDSEEVSGSQQGASELSAPGVLEGTESMDDLGDGSLKGAIDMEGASAGSPDFEKVPDIPVNDFDEDEDDNDQVCDMDVGSERTDEPSRPRHDNDVDEDDDDDVEMASEGVTESGLESYGNADEDDFAEDERLDNLNRVAQPPPPPPLLPSAPAAQWDQPNPFNDPWAEIQQPQQALEPVQVVEAGEAAAASPLVDPWQQDSETPTQTSAQAWLELGSAPENQEVPNQSSIQVGPENLEAEMDASYPAPVQTLAPAPLSATGMSLSSTLSSESSTPEELGDLNRDGKLHPQTEQTPVLSPQPDQETGDKHVEEAEPETLPADEVLGGPETAPTSNPSSSSVTEDEASDTEGEAQLDDSLESPAVCSITFDCQSTPSRCLSTVEEEAEIGASEDATPPSATSLASYGFDTVTTASNSNAQSAGENCIKSPGIFSLEELSEEAKESSLIPQPHTEPCMAEQQYIECGKQEAESVDQVKEEAPKSEEAPDPSTLDTEHQEENPNDSHPPYFSAVCDKTEDSFTGFTALPHPHRRDHSAYPRTYYDIIKPHGVTVTPPKLTCADLPPRSPGQQTLSPQLRRLEQHQRQLLELQQRREQQNKPLEGAAQERKRRQEEEQRRKKEEAEEEIKRNKEEQERKMKEQEEAAKREEEEKVKKEEELKQRRELELQLQQQQQELKHRQQIMQWQQELQQSSKGQTVLLSPSSGLCTIYEALEASDEEEVNELSITKKEPRQDTHEDLSNCEKGSSDEDKRQDSLLSDSSPPLADSLQSSSNPSQDGESSSPSPTKTPERPPPLDLDWGRKVDIVQQLINQTLLLNGDGCSSLLLLPGGAGGTLSPLESSLWPSLLPTLNPPSATVTSVSSFSPEATGSSPQGEWTVVELETHH